MNSFLLYSLGKSISFVSVSHSTAYCLVTNGNVQRDLHIMTLSSKDTTSPWFKPSQVRRLLYSEKVIGSKNTKHLFYFNIL